MIGAATGTVWTTELFGKQLSAPKLSYWFGSSLKVVRYDNAAARVASKQVGP